MKSNLAFLFSSRTARLCRVGLLAFGCAAPVAAIVSGCGGGGSSSSKTHPLLLNARMNLSRQPAYLNMNVNGSAISGTLVVPTVGNPQVATRAFNFDIPTGVYSIKGQYTSPAGYSIAGDIPSVGTFVIDGAVPTNGNKGSYSFRVNGQEETGSFVLGPIPTPTATVVVN